MTTRVRPVALETTNPEPSTTSEALATLWFCGSSAVASSVLTLAVDFRRFRSCTGSRFDWFGSVVNVIGAIAFPEQLNRSRLLGTPVIPRFSPHNRGGTRQMMAFCEKCRRAGFTNGRSGRWFRGPIADNLEYHAQTARPACPRRRSSPGFDRGQTCPAEDNRTVCPGSPFGRLYAIPQTP